jgi:hypothetical protein
MRRPLAVVVVALCGALLLPALALAHLERPSYWPDPAPDTSVNPPAGGEVPEARSLKSALKKGRPGKTHVVCQGADGRKSLNKLRRSLKRAKKKGYRLRPSQPKTRVSKRKAKRLLKLNRKFAAKCKFKTIQKAVNKAGNNDRIVIMPGRYREKPSRKAPVNDPKCADLTQQDSSGAETPSYRYQVTCPNDQNLIYVQGRALAGDPLPTPSPDRHGIPEQELGECVRCNLQVEGSGVKPEDVILDGGSDYVGKGPLARPSSYAKHVILRADRADGFVGRNFLTRGALEFGFYTEETDGILLDRVKFFWAADYGHLSFTTDHNVIQNCEGMGAGDAAVYPGAAPETGEQANTDFYPDAPRINTVVRRCDLRGSFLGYSGSMGNAVRITNNHVYGNSLGIVTDTISAAGHPGFPADSLEVDHNYIYSNNLNLFTENPPIEPIAGLLPNGVGVLWAGHNNGRLHDNWIFDNWRNGAMLVAIPDGVVDIQPEGGVNPGISCETATLPAPLTITTSCGNQYFDNRMGQVPPGFRFPKALDDFGNPSGGTASTQPNGVDFWWDEFATNDGNCWFDNAGPDGTEGSVTGPGVGAPPDLLPSNCGLSLGLGDALKTMALLNCFLVREEGQDLPCDWDETPPQPATAQAQQAQRQLARDMRRAAGSEEAERIRAKLDEIAAKAETAP